MLVRLTWAKLKADGHPRLPIGEGAPILLNLAARKLPRFRATRPPRGFRGREPMDQLQTCAQ